MRNVSVIVGSIIITSLLSACYSIPEDHSLSYNVSTSDTLYICDASSCFLVTVFPGEDWTPVTNVIMVDKRQKRTCNLNVTNDIAGNLPVYKLATSINNGWYYEMFEPYKLLDLIDKRLSDSDYSDKDRKTLEKLESSINEDGNNIMFIGKLKEHLNLKF